MTQARTPWCGNAAMQPCKRDCPDRAPGCGAKCEKWQQYTQEREKEYDRRRTSYLIAGAINDGYRRMGKKG